ncbi:hypothetical protein SK128_002672 [Halocaridina rubra]|uniref:Regulatory protein zeste n=1 Tax=Halocaridina rubra TaxID=373956 RepID=A0AAN8X9V0_HALRR
MEDHETEEESSQKRYRSRNFTKYEKEVFYSVFSQYVGIIGDKNSSAYTIRDAWDKLVVEYNSQHNVYPRTRRQLQDRSPSKNCIEINGSSDAPSTSTCETVTPTKPIPAEGERHPSSLLTPLLTVIKREHEAYTAGEITPVLPLAPYPPPPPPPTEPCSTLSTKPKLKKIHGKVIKQEESYSRSPSPNRYTSADERVLPLPVEAHLHSGSSSPVVKHKYDDPTSDEDDIYWSNHSHHRRKARRNGNKIGNDTSVLDRNAIANRRERDIHKLKLQQLRHEGALRMRVLEMELALKQQQQQMEQQEHNLRMEILREKLKRIREGKIVGD